MIQFHVEVPNLKQESWIHPDREARIETFGITIRISQNAISIVGKGRIGKGGERLSDVQGKHSGWDLPFGAPLKEGVEDHIEILAEGGQTLCIVWNGLRKHFLGIYARRC